MFKQDEIDNLTAELQQTKTQLQQVYKERNSLAILSAVFVGAYLEAIVKVQAPSEFVGWSTDPEATPGFETVVYITPSEGKQISFHMSPEDAENAKALLYPFTGAWDGKFTGREQSVFHWLSRIQIDGGGHA